MTKDRFRELVKRHHPDRGGNRPDLVRMAIKVRRESRKREEKIKHCWCGAASHGRHCHIHAIRGRKRENTPLSFVAG